MQIARGGDELGAAVAGETRLLDRLVSRRFFERAADDRDGGSESLHVLLGEDGGDVDDLAAAHEPFDVALDRLVAADHRHQLHLHVDDDEKGVGAMKSRHGEGAYTIACSGFSPRRNLATSVAAMRAMAVRVSNVADPMCGARTTFGIASRRGFTSGSPS